MGDFVAVVGLALFSVLLISSIGCSCPYEFFWKFIHPIRWFRGWKIRKSEKPDVFEVYWNE